MAAFYLVRHGETEWNRDGRMQGQADVPLSAEGRAQAELLAKRLSSTRFDAMLSSDLSRAVETARIVQEQLEATPPLTISHELREVSDGAFEGMRVSEAAALDPRAKERTADGWPTLEYAPPEGESVLELFERQRLVADDLRERASTQRRVLVVGHGWALRALTASMLGLGAEGFWTLGRLGPASLSVIALANGVASVVSWDDGEHLT